MKKLAVFFVAMLIAGGIFLLADNEFVVADDPLEIEKELMKFLNRPSGTMKVEFLKMQQLGQTDTSIAVFSIDDNLAGYARLEKRPFNRVKIIHTGYGTAAMSYREGETNQGNYGLLYGLNPKTTVHQIQLTNLDTKSSKEVNVSKEEVILKADKITSDTERVQGVVLVYFDKVGNEITMQ